MSYYFGHAWQLVLAEKSPLKSLTTLHEIAWSNPQQSILHRQDEVYRTPPQRGQKNPTTMNWPVDIISVLTFWGPSQPSHVKSSKFSHCTESSRCCRNTSSAGIVSSSVTLIVVGVGLAWLKERRQARMWVIPWAASHPSLGSSLSYSLLPEVSAVVGL